jgi:hypothetical protein
MQVDVLWVEKKQGFHRHSLAVSFSISSWRGANSLRSIRLNSCNKNDSVFKQRNLSYVSDTFLTTKFQSTK